LSYDFSDCRGGVNPEAINFVGPAASGAHAISKKAHARVDRRRETFKFRSRADRCMPDPARTSA
jgi:hypothetical protein